MFEQLIVWYRIFFVWLYGHVGFALAILSTSVITSFLMKPIAKVIMKWVKREIEYEGVLNPLVAEIKSSDKSGAEKQFALAELYKQYGYSPILEVRKVLPLFVQLPCLFLTYYMLEGAEILKGVSFLCFKDVGAADALLPMGVNLLPFVMTGINFIAIYSTPSFTRKDRIQAIVVALAFLVLLYPACAALMIYWTLNNLFTCLKTLTEEHYSGARLLCERVKWACCGGAWNACLAKLKSMSDETLGYASFVSVLFSVYSCAVYCHYAVSTGLANIVFPVAMILFSVGALFVYGLMLYRARGVKHAKGISFILWGTGMLLLLAIGVMCVDKLMVGTILYGRYATFLKTLFAIGFAVNLIGMFALRKVCSVHKTKFFGCKAEMLGYCLLICALAVHYLLSSPDLGLSITAFIVLPCLMLVPFVVMTGLFVALTAGLLNVQSVMRFVFVFFAGYYVTPILNSENMFTLTHNNMPVCYVVIGALLIVYLLAINKCARFVHVFILLFSLSLVGNGVLNYVKMTSAQNASDGSAIDVAIDERFPHLKGLEVKNKHNIYILLYDGYPNRMITEFVQMYNPQKYLSERGFKVYKESYQSGGSTGSSMSDFFDVFCNSKYSWREKIQGHVECMEFLKANGYYLSYIMDSMLCAKEKTKGIGDFYFPKLKDDDPISKILILWGLVKSGYINANADFTAGYTAEEKRIVKDEQLALQIDKPVFVYAHDDIPGHFYNGGTRAAYYERDGKLLRVKTQDVEKEIERDLSLIKDWDNSVIIFASDHGTYLTGRFDDTPLGLLDLYGTQLAIKWPKGYEPTMDVSFARNVMLEVLICLTGDKSLARFKNSGKTRRGNPKWVNVPDGAVDNGIIQVGPAKGRNLFDAAREELQAMKVK